MPWSPSRRAELRGDVEEWIAHRRDPRDPLTQPVILLLRMYLAATSWWAMTLPIVVATLFTLTFVAITNYAAKTRAPATVEVREDEQLAMQEWIASGEASRVMRCEDDGLVFADGLCRTTADGGWLIPLAAQQRLAKLAKDKEAARFTPAEKIAAERERDTSWRR